MFLITEKALHFLAGFLIIGKFFISSRCFLKRRVCILWPTLGLKDGFSFPRSDSDKRKKLHFIAFLITRKVFISSRDFLLRERFSFSIGVSDNGNGLHFLAGFQISGRALHFVPVFLIT